MSAGIILVDRQGRVLLQLRDANPGIMFPDHWGITGGAAHAGETPEQTARREVEEETGLTPGRMEPFRAYYFSERPSGARPSSKARADYELYLFHAPCETPAEEMVCGEGRALRFFAPGDVAGIDIAYNHRDVLTDFFAAPAYRAYVTGDAFDGGDPAQPLARFIAALDAGEPWFDALMRAIALWERPDEQTAARHYRYLVGGEAFDWLLLAERLLGEAGERIPADEAERLLFEAVPPGAQRRAVEDSVLRERIGESKHRAHLNYLYGVVVEQALQYAVELEVGKERIATALRDVRDGDPRIDPVFERIYGEPRIPLLRRFRDEQGLRHRSSVTLAEWQEFQYWLFKYRVKQCEPARVASDTRKALAQLSEMENGVRRSGRRQSASADAEEMLVG